MSLLDILLQDKSTKGNIIWATDTYSELGEGFGDEAPITRTLLLLNADAVQPRIRKSQEDQQARTRKKAEVFTSSRLCNRMNNHCDETWFGRKNVFNTEQEDGTWTATEAPIAFPEGKTWKQYVDSRRLEISCGEAPFLVSRYDASTGEVIPHTPCRIGVLDRKLRVVNEHAKDADEWLRWAFRAYDATYGYEYQGDSLLIARLNLLMTFVDYYRERWGKEPEKGVLRRLAHRIAWNIWQMDGLKDCVPLGKLREENRQMLLFDFFPDVFGMSQEIQATPCKIHNWRSKITRLFKNLKKSMNSQKPKMFDYVIGNPPYNEDFANSGENGNFGKALYPVFMDAAYEVANKVILVHPARFLFNIGATPKPWNKKMLNDPHFKVLEYEADCSKVFPNTDIKGGIVITYRDSRADFGAIGTFIVFRELECIGKKAGAGIGNTFSSLIYAPESYRFTERMYEEQPDAVPSLSNGSFKSSVLGSLHNIVFWDEAPNDGGEYVGVWGVVKGKRVFRWIRREYVKPAGNFEYYKVFVPKSNGSGALGEELSTPLIGEPLIGHTQTFISIGKFETLGEAEACMKYVKTKLARVLLGIKKVTQDNPRDTWEYVPLQDFTEKSDIDWTRTVAEIDRQLYAKYGLDEEEIRFIETHVKEMK